MTSLRCARISRRVLGVAVAITAVTAVPLAQGGNPHFVNAKTRIDDFALTLSVDFKAVGLGNISGQVVDIVLVGDVTAAFRCQTNGGRCPEAPRFKNTGNDQLAVGTFPVSANGQVSGTLTVDESIIPENSGVPCPNGQTEIITGVTYEDMELQIVYNSQVLASLNLADASKNLSVCRVKGKPS